jgi:Ca2+-binding EF-hand superfamily protein
MKRVDTNKDGKISPAEMQSALSRSFDLLDTNHDGILTKAEIDNRRSVYKAYHKQARAERKAGQHVAGVMRIPKGVEKHFAKLDANHDGVLSKAELSNVAQHVFKRRDHDKDGYISAADLKA